MRAFMIRSDRRQGMSQKGLGQKGFSMAELMVVVCIVGLLATAAVVTMTTDPDVEDECAKIAGLVNEAARQAISGGSVRPETSQSSGITERGQLRIVTDAAGPSFLVERLREPPPEDPGAELVWVERNRVHLGKSVTVAGWSPSAELEPGTTPLIPGPSFSPPFFDKPTKCHPDGTCTAMTLYLQDAKRPDRKARVVVLPLNGMMTQCFSGW
jgi:prepilin-type N-terminal cleavage/methylation domain-containing protein